MYTYLSMYNNNNVCEPGFLRPVSLLRLSLLRFVDSNFPKTVPMDMRIPPLKIKFLLESDPLKSRILVRRLAVLAPSPWVGSSQRGV